MGASEEKEKKSKRKRKERELDDSPEVNETPAKNVEDRDDAKNKEKKHRSKEERKLDRERKKAAKKAEKSSLLDQVPKVDEHGIAYTRIQIRRMTRRVKRGLPPVPTEEEERERLREIKKEKKVEEEELAGMIFDREKEATDEDEGREEKDAVSDGENEDAEGDDEKDESDSGQSAQEQNIEAKRPAKKKKSNKPVPSDYVCQACNNKRSPPHWIYDCPDKVHRPGSNQIKKKMKGINMPDPRKVYVSGMPFGVRYGDVRGYFEDKAKCGKIAKCHLVTFKDESARCKGEAFITFETEEGAKKAIATSGDIMTIEEKKDKKGKQVGGGDSGAEKKELRLKVSKVVNKAAAKRKNKYFSMMRKG